MISKNKNGIAVLNIGAETSEIICLKENSYIYIFLPMGSKILLMIYL